jgi:hypothetical protein
MRNPMGNSASLAGAPADGSVSRRTFVGAVGAAGILAASARVLPAEQAAKSAHCFFGSSARVFLDIQRGEIIPGTNPPVHSRPVPGLRGVRIYGVRPDSRGSHLARRWPAGPSPTTQGPIVYSIYPPLQSVIDSDRATMRAIQNIIDTAPPNSYLNAWHEALSLPASTPRDATPARLKLVHSKLNEMCQKSSNVTYGALFGGDANFLVHHNMPLPAGCPPKAGKPHVWQSVPDDLGFYGIDVYGGNAIDKNMCFLETFISNAKLKARNGYPKIVIGETNNKSTDANRVEWFERVAERMHRYGSHAVGILTFWGDAHAPLSGPWDPSRSKVINGMNHVINKILV